MSVPESTVLDSKSQPILKGSIVGAIETTKWDQYQGLVLDPNSEAEGNGFTVAVFFHREVCSSQFNQGTVVREWDQRHEAELADTNHDWILEERTWTDCPRVVFFRPDELVVEPDWKLEFYVKRTFPNGFHALFELKDKSSFIPGSHECTLVECHHPATRVALLNVWGSIYPVRTCEGCFAKFHGMCGDELPARKPHPVPIDAKVLAD
jgi:hypothetical protein